jgi:hypothetical protein
MQLQGHIFYSKIFIGLDIHKKKLDSFYQTDLFFTRPIRTFKCRICINMWSEHFQILTVDLVYEAGCCGFSAMYYLVWKVRGV